MRTALIAAVECPAYDEALSIFHNDHESADHESAAVSTFFKFGFMNDEGELYRLVWASGYEDLDALFEIGERLQLDYSITTGFHEYQGCAGIFRPRPQAYRSARAR